MTEIEIPRGLLISTVVVLVISVVIITGVQVSPRNASGRPLVLSPERRAVLRFLRAADIWESEIARILYDLDRLSEEIQASPVPENLYSRAQSAQSILDRIRKLEKDIISQHTPDTMLELHQLAIASVRMIKTYAESVAARVGVPENEISGGPEAHSAFQKFQEALRAARGNP